MTRRLGLLATVVSTLSAPSFSYAQETVSFATYGGATQEGIRKALIEPIQADHDIQVQVYSILSGMSEIRTKVQAQANEFDVVELYAGQCQQAANEGLLVPLDYSAIPNAEGIPENMKGEHWIGYFGYSTVLAWNKNVYGANTPKGWADFYDPENFPGARAIAGLTPTTNLEIALVADGADREALYPLDADRGFEKMNELFPHIAVMFNSGAQASQLAQTEEVDMMSIFSSAIVAAIRDGAPFDFTYEGAVMDVECLVVPKYSPNPEGAMRFINHMVDPDYQANMPDHLPYGPLNQRAFDEGRISEEVAAQVTTSPQNLSKQLILDKAYWSANGQQLQERFDAFKNQ